MADDFIKDVRELWSFANEADRDNREEAIEDLKFAAGEQWDEAVRNYRESSGPFPLPCLTINTLPQFIGQVIGDRRANATAIKVLPREDGDATIAEVRSELIRSIELQSRADRVYANTFEQAVTCGVGNLRIDLDYAYEDAFDRDIFLRDIPNPLAVKWDPLAHDPTARDATFCFVGDEIATEEYRRRFPKAALPSLIQREAGSAWTTGRTVMVPEYWRIEERKRTIGMTADGKTVDLTDMPRTKWPQLAIDPETQQPIVRDDAKCKYAIMVLTNGMEQLTDPLELKLPRLPIIRVLGREVWTGEKRVRFGIVRCLRDSQRIKNYLRSLRLQLLMGAPRENFISQASSIKGRENDWPNTLVFNDGTERPQQITADNLIALLNEERIYAQDMMDVTGIFDASRGMKSNETSGIAIARRQQEGDIATIVYHDNMDAAQMECGDVCNYYLPIAFDTTRTVRLIGQNEAVKFLKVNDPSDPDSIDLSKGRYDVTIATGPAYMTRRIEAAAQLTELASKSPQLIEIAGDKIIESMDIPDGDEIAARVKRAIPPQILGDEADDNMSDDEKAAKAQQAQQAQAVQQQMAELEMRKTAAETAEAEAKAREANAKADLAEAEAREKSAGQMLMGADLANTADNLDTQQDEAA